MMSSSRPVIRMPYHDCRLPLSGVGWLVFGDTLSLLPPFTLLFVPDWPPCDLGDPGDPGA